MMGRRDGFTMIEMLLVLVLGTMVMAAAYTTLIRQSQSYGVFSAITGTQQDARTGIDLLAAELRELSANGGDLALATPGSVQFRALRSFGILCANTHKLNKKLVVQQFGVQPFRTGDSVLVYVDGDSLQAADDRWQREYVTGTTTTTVCGTTLGANLVGLFGTPSLIELTVGPTLRADSIFPGAPIRAFDVLTYQVGMWDGRPMLLRKQGSDVAPLLGPIEDPGGIELSYFDAQGNQLTAFPLDAATRASVRRIQVRLRAERQTGSWGGTHQDSLVTDVYLRGS